MGAFWAELTMFAVTTALLLGLLVLLFVVIKARLADHRAEWARTMARQLHDDLHRCATCHAPIP